MTARWVVEGVASQRELNIVWQPISLLFKNEPDPDSEYYAAVVGSHRMLRVMEALRTAEGEDAAFRWYWLCGTRIHQDQDRDFSLADALAELGYDPALAAAADDEKWDADIRTRMDAGLALVGDDVGTPIIAFTPDDGVTRGIFGPVMSNIPTGEQALAVWDAMEAFTTMDGFWELKRTRTEGPNFGENPDPR